MLTLILTRLPSKSLLVSKSVSKQWLSWINDPKFVHKHFIQNPKLSIPGLFWGCELSSTTKPTYGCIPLDGNANSHVPFETIDFKLGKLVRECIKIVQSCNGLLLGSNCVRYNRDRTYYIFNPFTKQYKVLPQSHMRGLHFPYLRNVSLVFDPLKSPYYRVIYFWRSRDLKYRTEIYHSETSSWRLSGLDSSSLPADAILWTPSIFWNGSLYWCDRDRKGVISYFDVDHELVGLVPLPTPAGFCRLLEGEKVMSMQGREEEKQSTKVVLLTEKGRVVTYDLKDMIIEEFHDLSARGQLDVSVQFHQYIESLACVESFK